MKILNTVGAVLCGSLLFFTTTGYAQDRVRSGATDSPLDEIEVRGNPTNLEPSMSVVEDEFLTDTASVLRKLPGANVNSNGRLTGIAQYRGMYGDRVSVTLDQHEMTGGGPNAMDAPLSYASPMITEELALERGIAGVAWAPEAIGGHIDAKLARGSFADSDAFGAAGFLGARYSGNGDTLSTAGRLSVSNLSHRVSLIAQRDEAGDIATPAGVIRPSGLLRDRTDLSYAFASDRTQIMVFAGLLNTEDTGTPALPMDIRLIDTRLYGFQFTTVVHDGLAFEASLGYNDVEHDMDNFSLRQPPADMMAYRQNHATGSGSSFSLSGILDLAYSQLQIGIDGNYARHDSLISNPNNGMFGVDNFVDTSRDLLGVFAEWRQPNDLPGWGLGVRLNNVSVHSGDVAARGMMGMMAANVAILQDRFNAADRNQDYQNLDVVARYKRDIATDSTLMIDIGSRTRAPAYQELYLWLPLQSTAGLADGRNYLGSLDLESERSHEVSIGIDWRSNNITLLPQIFYKRVDDYIQGVPSTNTVANMVSMMMSGTSALQFENVDAELYGADLAMQVQITEKVSLDAIASYTRGKRRDVSDNLYRLAPLNGSLAVSYKDEHWSLGAELVGYARQDKVSEFNAETQTAGYGLVNANLTVNPTEVLRIEFLLHNILDKRYQDHLTGINRAAGGDIPVGSRLYGAERSFGAGLTYRF